MPTILNPLIAPPPGTLPAKVVEVAKRFIGQNEVGSNAGFASPEFQKEMQLVGWLKGQAWCSYLAELVFKVTLEELKRPVLWKNIEHLFSANAIETLHRFERKGYVVRQTPRVGDIAVWRHGNGPAGHMGVVVEVNEVNKSFLSVEGNTSTSVRNSTVIVRDGDGVCLKKRWYGLAISNKPGSFNLLGFVAPVS